MPSQVALNTVTSLQGAGEKDVTDNFAEHEARLLMRFLFLPAANISSHFLHKDHFLKRKKGEHGSDAP